MVDDVVADELPEGASNKLQTLRKNWRNFKTIEPLLEKGEINPTQLINRVAASKYIKASRSKIGDDELVDLARIGKELMPKLGGSDTFQKSALAGGSIVGGAGLVTNPLATLTTAVAVPAANRGLQKTVSNQKLIDLAIHGTQGAGKKLPNTPLSGLISAQEAIRQ